MGEFEKSTIRVAARLYDGSELNFKLRTRNASKYSEVKLQVRAKKCEDESYAVE